MEWQKGCQTTLWSDYLGDSKTLRLCVRRTRCWNFLNILNVTISSELLWPAAPPCPAGLVLVSGTKTKNVLVSSTATREWKSEGDKFSGYDDEKAVECYRQLD